MCKHGGLRSDDCWVGACVARRYLARLTMMCQRSSLRSEIYLTKQTQQVQIWRIRSNECWVGACAFASFLILFYNVHQDMSGVQIKEMAKSAQRYDLHQRSCFTGYFCQG